MCELHLSISYPLFIHVYSLLHSVVPDTHTAAVSHWLEHTLQQLEIELVSVRLAGLRSNPYTEQPAMLQGDARHLISGTCPS